MFQDFYIILVYNICDMSVQQHFEIKFPQYASSTDSIVIGHHVVDTILETNLSCPAGGFVNCYSYLLHLLDYSE